ncbi:MAG: isoprenylcysteine carboxylmethyltransferase family protein [Proteobacteria bacterium]|nr:isoprenylcysteine carboxylmethyltransferase family protein [Pseudomonadota bacterium]MDA1022022.1 isoprenylcysteine carboxylmethyltransferase family protein [Pseudomonadota bacterium]
MESLLAHVIYGSAWASFGAVHSILAGSAAKNRLQRLFGAYYRLSYNLFAVFTIAAVWTLGLRILGGEKPFDLGKSAEAGLLGVSVLGWTVLLLALREYDLGQFSGLAQIRTHRQKEAGNKKEPLVTGGLHRFVRHPLYLGAYMILWGGAVNNFGLATAVWGSVYLFIGARYEEKKLLIEYGEAYREYQGRVPAILPWKGWG